MYFRNKKIKDIISRKGKEKITMLTAYDFSFASILDEAGIDIILVGDSMANVVLGMSSTKDISFKEMFNHTRAVKRAVKRALVVADMPYVSYQINKKRALYYAKKFVEEAGADAVKLEWFSHCEEITRILIKNNIAVMGHIGLTPQTADKLGGFKVQGKDSEKALILIKQADTLDKLGVFSLVIECVPSKVSRLITERVKSLTIGIGAGNSCDGQVLVLYDLLGFYKRIKPKFVREYADLSSIVNKAVTNFISDIKKGSFPSPKESFSINEEESRRLIQILKDKSLV